MANEAAGEQTGKVKVWVRAVPREDFGGFCRAGRFWPSANVTEADVTPDELAVLRAEAMLMVFDRPPLGSEPKKAPANGQGKPPENGQGKPPESR